MYLSYMLKYLRCIIMHAYSDVTCTVLSGPASRPAGARGRAGRSQYSKSLVPSYIVSYVRSRAYRAAEGGERACNSANGIIQIDSAP